MWHGWSLKILPPTTRCTCSAPLIRSLSEAIEVDGNTSCFGYGIRSEAATMLLNMEEGKGRVWRSVRGTYHPARQYDYGSWFRLLFFVGLFLTPFPWARRSWRAASNGRPQEPK